MEPLYDADNVYDWSPNDDVRANMARQDNNKTVFTEILPVSLTAQNCTDQHPAHKAY